MKSNRCPNCGNELIIGEECFIHTKKLTMNGENNIGISIKIADCSNCKIGYIC